jgi:REP element-mobilizing transposase RayT
MSLDRIRTRGRLPHWEGDRAIYFVTFRLADSLPRASRLEAELQRSRTQKPMASRSRRLEALLDNGAGACYLANPKIAVVVRSALMCFDGDRYRLFAWCLMPNHVHVVFQPAEGNALAEILHSWKSFTAQQANQLLGKRGPFWQREYHDHLIRNAEQFTRAVHYVAENPVRVGLTNWPWVYVGKW